MFCCTYFQHIVCDKFYNNDFFLLVFKAKRSRSLGGEMKRKRGSAMLHGMEVTVKNEDLAFAL